jgi:hypothetical protein
MAALAAAKSRALAEALGGHRRQRHALGDGKVMRTVRSEDRVVRAEVRDHADGNRFLPRGQVHLARDRPRPDVKRQPLLDVRGKLSLEVDLRHGLLVVANPHHRFVHPQQLLPRGRSHHSLLLFPGTPNFYITSVTGPDQGPAAVAVEGDGEVSPVNRRISASVVGCGTMAPR